jgi:hypothetical protein
MTEEKEYDEGYVVDMGALKRDIAGFVLDLMNEYLLTELDRLELLTYLDKKAWEQKEECIHKLRKD